MDKMIKIHQEVLRFLLDWKEKEEAKGEIFNFTLRKSNREDKLKDGYWFYGNESYLAVSFWTGMDWKNRTPNIYFLHTLAGDNYLETSASDSQFKQEFIEKYLYNSLDMVPVGRSFRKYYKYKSVTEALEEFLTEDKPEIDRIIEEQEGFFKPFENHRIGFIDKSDYEKWLFNIKKYGADVAKRRFPDLRQMPNALLSFSIQKFKPIENVSVENIGIETKWIFVTGVNGSGKTSLLRALAIGLAGTKDISGAEFTVQNNPSFVVKVGVSIDGNPIRSTVNPYHEDGVLLPKGFVAYGPGRLITERYLQEQNNTWLNDATDNDFFGLFHPTGVLYDLDVQLNKWKTELPLGMLDERFGMIKEALIAIIPSVGNVELTDFGDGDLVVLYYEIGEDGITRKEAVQWPNLASGTKSLIALVSDLFIRFYSQQSDIVDLGEFEGIVIIDEIDLHLHPELQRQLVEELTKTFPGIQFIVSTHSPIPLLGAPKDSVFLRVYRDAEEGVTVEKLDIEFSNLLPNTLLTSPIFGFDKLIPDSHSRKERLNTEDTYHNVLDRVANRKFLKEVAEKLKGNQ